MEMKYIMYVRKSSEDEGKQIQSNEDQVKELEKSPSLAVLMSWLRLKKADQPKNPVGQSLIRCWQ